MRGTRFWNCTLLPVLTLTTSKIFLGSSPAFLPKASASALATVAIWPAAGLSAHRPVLCQLARKSGAVGCSAALVSHPQRGAAKISARPPTHPASTASSQVDPASYGCKLARKLPERLEA